MSEDENDTEGVSSKVFSIDDKEMQNEYYKSIARVIIGAIIALIAFFWDAIFLLIIALLTIPIGILIWLYGLYGIYSYKFKPEKYRKALEKRKKYVKKLKFEPEKYRKALEKRKKYVKKKSKILFMVGTIIIGISCLVMWWDLGTRLLGGWTGFYTFLVTPLYILGVLLVVYSIHLIGNKWGWLDFPIAIVFFVALWQISYRLAVPIVFPLNYLALLILFLTVLLRRRKRVLEGV